MNFFETEIHFFTNCTHFIGFFPIAVSAARTNPFAPWYKLKKISFASALWVTHFESLTLID